MASVRHPFDPDTIYRKDEDGNVRVSNGNSVGIFSPQGVHLSGDIRHADPQMCVWVGNTSDPATYFRRPGRNSILVQTESAD